MWVSSQLRATDLQRPQRNGTVPPYLNVHVVLRHVDKGGQALAEPHGDLPVHVDGKRLEALLQAAHRVVLEGAGVLAQVHATDLGHSQTAHRDET